MARHQRLTEDQEQLLSVMQSSRSWTLTGPLRAAAASSASGETARKRAEMGRSAVCIVTASGQNLFFEELMDAVEAALADRGLTTERAVDHFPAAREGLAYLFVPHEYMPLVLPEAHPTQAQLDRSVALCTEQPGTHWFDEAAGVAARSARAVDLNREGVAELRRRGIGADLLQLGHVPGWDHWGGDESSPGRST